MIAHVNKLLDFIASPILLGGSFLAASALAQVAGGVANVTSDVSFSAAEIALIGVIATPVVASVTLLFKSLLAAKDETIRIQQLTITAMQLRINEGLVREGELQNRLISAFTGALRENVDILHEVVAGVHKVADGVDKLDSTQDRRHNEFVKLMTSGDRRTSDSGPSLGRRSDD